VEQLEDPRATFGRFVELDMEVRDPADPKPFPELMTDVGQSPTESGERRRPFRRLADDADPDPGVGQIGCRFDPSNRREPEPRIGNVPGQQGADLLPQQLVDPLCALAHRRPPARRAGRSGHERRLGLILSRAPTG